MLVGDHGHVIQFHRFKGAAIGGICLLTISIIVLIVLTITYARQRERIGQFQSELENLRRQAVQLRDEKDLYLTQLIARQEQQAGAFKQAEAASKPSDPSSEPAVGKNPPPKPPSIKSGVDIRGFKATYNAARQMLEAKLKIHNTSKPKKVLTGRIVVVFKNLDDTSIHWLAVPRAQLTNGEPSGSRGEQFRINNYRTFTFRAFEKNAPAKYNMATAFIFSDEGKLLIRKDFTFNVGHEPTDTETSGINTTLSPTSLKGPSILPERTQVVSMPSVFLSNGSRLKTTCG